MTRIEQIRKLIDSCGGDREIICLPSCFITEMIEISENMAESLEGILKSYNGEEYAEQALSEFKKWNEEV